MIMGSQLDGLFSHWQPAFANKLIDWIDIYLAFTTTLEFLTFSVSVFTASTLSSCVLASCCLIAVGRDSKVKVRYLYSAATS